MAKYQRGMAVSPKATAKSVAKGTRGMAAPAKVTAASVPAGTRGMAEKNDAKDPDPWGNYRFKLVLNTPDGQQADVAHFMECTGLKTTAEVFEIAEGGLNGRTHKRPGQSKWENITLRFGASSSNLLAAWRDRYLMDKFTEGDRIDPNKSSGAVVLMNNSGTVLRRYEFKNAWPVSWEGPSLSSSGSDLAVESLEIAHEGLTITEGDA